MRDDHPSGGQELPLPEQFSGQDRQSAPRGSIPEASGRAPHSEEGEQSAGNLGEESDNYSSEAESPSPVRGQPKEISSGSAIAESTLLSSLASFERIMQSFVNKFTAPTTPVEVASPEDLQAKTPEAAHPVRQDSVTQKSKSEEEETEEERRSRSPSVHGASSLSECESQDEVNTSLRSPPLKRHRTDDDSDGETQEVLTLGRGQEMGLLCAGTEGLPLAPVEECAYLSVPSQCWQLRDTTELFRPLRKGHRTKRLLLPRLSCFR